MRTITLELDELDFDAVQKAMARRDSFGRNIPGCEDGLLPDGESSRDGALVAEICRGWLEMLDAAEKRRRQ